MSGVPRTPVGRPQLDPVKLRRWMQAREISPAKLATRSGRALGSVRSALRGVPVGARVLAGLAAALDVLPRDLLEDPPESGELFSARSDHPSPGPVHGRRRVQCPF